MLNPAFSKKIAEETNGSYILPRYITSLVMNENIYLNTGLELRLQKIYGDELFFKLKSLGLENFDWKNKDVLDLACGTGFLSYHLLTKVKPKSLILADISEKEIEEAKKLLVKFSGSTHLKFIVGDITKTNFDNNSFDMVIGNSFLHHFYDLPAAINEFKRILKPGGLFITLHEPTISSLALESRNPRILLRYIFYGNFYIDKFYRYKGEGVAPGQGADVWMFKEEDLKKIFLSQGFENVNLQSWHCFRPKLVAVFGMHLGNKKKELNIMERFLLKMAILCDSVLRRFLSPKFFGSVALLANKPY